MWEFFTNFGYLFFRILPTSLLRVSEWRDELENYRLSNYLAVSPEHATRLGIKEASPNAKACVIVFSKDRAMQLDCTLRSLQIHCKDIDQADVTALYTTSADTHEGSYRKLKESVPGVRFLREKAFKNDLLSVLTSFDCVLFLVDDNIFVRKFSIAGAVNALVQCDSAVGLSLRLGKNTTYCYMHEKDQSVPPLHDVGGDVLLFDWTNSELDFGYPLELSSSVYRVSDLLPLLRNLDFSNPNTLEAALDANKSAYAKTKPKLLCYETSVAFCNPLNMVQNVFTGNRARGDGRYSPENLVKHYMNGYRIRASQFSGFTPNSCHQEVDYTFDRGEDSRLIKEAAVVRARGPLVTIGLLNCNGLDQIKVCLEAIARNTPEDHEIIIVDNGSADGSVEYLRSLADVVLIENPKNLGPTTRNKFLALARGRYIVFLDNDTIVTKDWLTRLVRLAAIDAKIGIIGACANWASGLQLVQNTSYKNTRELEEFAASRACRIWRHALAFTPPRNHVRSLEKGASRAHWRA